MVRLGPHGIPYRVSLLGQTIKTRWGDPSGEAIRRGYADHGAYCEAEKTIYLGVHLRRKAMRRDAWKTYVHELCGHAFNHVMRGITVTDIDGRKWKWRAMSHERINLNETPLAMLMLENPGVFSPCPPTLSARSSPGSKSRSQGSSSQ